MTDPDRMTDWEDLGDNIREIIDTAVNSQNYQMLNQTITQAVEKAMDTGGEAVRRAVDAAVRYQKSNKNVYSSNLGSYSARSGQRVTPSRNIPHQSPVHSAPPAAPVQEPRQNLPVLYRSTSGKMTGGILKTVGGGILTFSTAMSLMFTAVVRSLILGTAFMSFSTVVSMLGLGGGVYLLGSGIRSIGRVNRFEKYVRALGTKTHATVEQLARAVGKPTRFVRRELPGMIEEGLFLEGHMDAENNSLITSNETYAHYQQVQQKQELKKLEEARQALVESQKPKASAQVQEVLDKGNEFIRQIRRCNDAIPGEEISRKISHMENIVRKIFDRAEAHPEIVPDLKKLMDYYLPMTVKLLNAYADMDAQPVQGETIQNSKREIEATLDTLNSAFEKLLDSVFQQTALDVSSDITVLQTLLAQEGLTDDELTKMKKETR